MARFSILKDSRVRYCCRCINSHC